MQNDAYSNHVYSNHVFMSPEHALNKSLKQHFREFRACWWVPTWPKPEKCRLLTLNNFQDHVIAASCNTTSVSWPSAGPTRVAQTTCMFVCSDSMRGNGSLQDLLSLNKQNMYISLSLYIYIYIYTHTYTHTHCINLPGPNMYNIMVRRAAQARAYDDRAWRSFCKEVVWFNTTPNLPTTIIPPKIRWLKLSGNMDMRIHPLESRLWLSQTLWNPES